MKERAFVPGEGWLEVEATVLSSTFHYTPLWNIDYDSPIYGSYHAVDFSYQVAGKTYHGQFEQYDA